MPIKLKPSTTARDRKTGKVKVEHHYIKSQSDETLINLLNTTTINKSKRKIRNELTRRKIKLVTRNMI